MDHLLERLEKLGQQTHTVQRSLRWWRVTALLLLILGLVSLPWQMAHTQEEATAQAPEEAVDADLEEEFAAQAQEDIDPQALTLAQRVAALEPKLKYLSTTIDANGRPLMHITGANVRIVNGQNATKIVNGLGNLIVGYNELCGSGNVRMGSHNVVLELRHNYSRFGGLVVSSFNTISGGYASICGGTSNVASGAGAAVSGGWENTASSENSAVSGGLSNIARA